MRIPELRLDGKEFEVYFMLEVVPYLVKKGAVCKSYLGTTVDEQDGVDFDVTFEGRLYRVDACCDTLYKLRQMAAKGGGKKATCIIGKEYVRTWIKEHYGKHNDARELLEKGRGYFLLLSNAAFRASLAHTAP